MAYTKAQLEALAAQLLASQQPIAASQHRSQVQTLIDELFSAQSRGNVLAGVQSTASTVANDTALIFRNGAAFRIPLSALAAVNLSDLGDVFISNPQNLESLVYNEVNDRWENINISSAFVPYTGALQAVNLGFNSLTASTLIVGGTSSSQGSYLGLKQFTNVITGALGFTSISATSTNLVNFNFGQTTDFKSFSFDVTNITGINARVYLMPNANGTIALTSDITTALAAYQLLSQKGQANGYAQLDGNAKLPISIIPDSIIGQVEYMGTWNAATNTPTLPTTPAEKGHYYVTSVAGTFVGISFEVGDWIISNGTAWEKVDNTDAVTMVFGRIGSITAQRPDYASFYVDIEANQTINGFKNFSSTIFANAGVRLPETGTALPTFLANINGPGLSSFGSNGLGFNNANNLYFSGSNKQGGVFVFNNAGIRNYTLQDASGTLAFTSDITTALGDYVTLGTSQTITGIKTFNSGSLILAAEGTANSTHLRNSSGDSTTVAGSNTLGFNSSNNIYVRTVSKGGFILSFNNGAANRVYTLQDGTGTLAFTSDITNALAGYVTLGTAQTITAQKTFSTSGESDTLIVNHTSGSGIALNISKAGNGEGLRVAKTSGSGNAVTITGGLFSAENGDFFGALNGTSGNFSGDLQSGTRVIAASGGQSIILHPNAGGSINRIEGSAGAPLHIITSGSSLAFAAGGATPQVIINNVGNLSAPSANISGLLTAQQGVFSNSGVPAIQVIRNLNVQVVGSASQGIEFGALNGSTPTIGAAIFGGLDNPATSGSLVFQTRTAGNLTTKLTIASAGEATFSSSVAARNFTSFRNDGGVGLDVNGGDAEGITYIALFRDFFSNPQVVITGSGRLGIGTLSPAMALQVGDGTQTGNHYIRVFGSASDIYLGQTGSNLFGAGNGQVLVTDASRTTNFAIGTLSGSANLIFGTASTERLRLTTDGFIFTESQVQISSGLVSAKLNIGALLNSGQNCITLQSFQSPAGGNYILFLNNAGGIAGSITHNGTNVVAYNMTSDYRLKEDLREIKGLEKIQAIKVYDYKWKGEESRMDGVLAHELKEIVPYSVTGEKDAKQMQSVDYSKLVPVLIRAIQELKQEIDLLKN